MSLETPTVTTVVPPYFTHSPALVRTVIALIAYPDEGARAHVGVAYHASAVALLAQPTDRHTRLLAAEDEIRVVLRHRGFGIWTN